MIIEWHITCSIFFQMQTNNHCGKHHVRCVNYSPVLADVANIKTALYLGVGAGFPWVCCRRVWGFYEWDTLRLLIGSGLTAPLPGALGTHRIDPRTLSHTLDPIQVPANLTGSCWKPRRPDKKKRLRRVIWNPIVPGLDFSSGVYWKV